MYGRPFSNLSNPLIAVLTITFWFACPHNVFAKEIRAGFMEKCPTTNFPIAGTQPEALQALLVGLAGAFLDKAVDTGIAGLKSAVTPEARSIEGYFFQQGLYKLRQKTGDEKSDHVIPNPSLACLVIVIGEFGATQEWNLQFPVDSDRTATGAVTSLSDRFGLNAPPLVYFEAVRVFSDDNTAVTWRPVRVYVSQFMNSGIFAGKSRGLAIEFGLQKPGITTSFASQIFAFDDVALGGTDNAFSKTPTELVEGKSNNGKWISIPAATKSADSGGLVVGKVFDPFTLYVRVVESPKPYQLAQMFVGAIEAKSSDIKTNLQEQVLPSVAASVGFTASTAAVTALSTYQTDLTAVTDNCAAAKVGTADGLLQCRIAGSKATLSLSKAKLTCELAGGGKSVVACAAIPDIPAFP